MRLLPAALLAGLLAALVVPAPATAQEAGAPLLLLEDDKADVAAQGAGPPTVLPTGSWDSMDLVSLSVQETPTEFNFLLEVASLEPQPTDTVLAAIQYEVVFRHVDEVYKVRAYASGGTYYGSLERLPDGVDPDQAYGEFLTEVEVTQDAATTSLVIAVPRDVLLDGQGSTPHPGRVLDLFSVDAGLLNDGTITISGQPVPMPSFEDRMPETGSGEAVLPVVFGIVQEGDLRLASEEPFRASNGEAATFVFRVNATNLGMDEQVGEFVVVGAPQAWDVRVPGLVRLQPNQSAEFPIIVRTEFGHAHGTATAFTLELVGQDGLSTGRIQLGLRYPRIAQPAGHHDTVYLHSMSMGGGDALAAGIGLLNKALSGYDYQQMPYFNTLADDQPTDVGMPISGQVCETLRIQQDNDTVGSTYCWYAPLAPGLEMGLDFDLSGLGSYSIPIRSLTPQMGARVQGRLLYFEPTEVPDDPFLVFFQEPVVVATLLPSERSDIGLDGRKTFEGVIRPEEAGDFLVYKRGASLHLQLEVRTDRVDNFFLGPKGEPELLPGGSFTLPLVDYADPVDEAFGLAGTLELVLDGDAHRMANPGDTLVYSVTLDNADAEGHDFAAAIVGKNREWARLVGAQEFGVDAGGSRLLTVAVTVPTDVPDGERADLVLEVASQDDVAVRALLRLVAIADTDAEHEDQSALLAEAAKAKGTPGTPLALLALALLVLVARRR